MILLSKSCPWVKAWIIGVPTPKVQGSNPGPANIKVHAGEIFTRLIRMTSAKDLRVTIPEGPIFKSWPAPFLYWGVVIRCAL